MRSTQFLARTFNIGWLFPARKVSDQNTNDSTATVDVEMGHLPTATSGLDSPASNGRHAQTLGCKHHTPQDLMCSLHGTTLSPEQTRKAGELIATLRATSSIGECLVNPAHTDTLIELHQLGVIDLNRIECNSDGYFSNAIQSICKHVLNDNFHVDQTATDHENPNALSSDTLSTLFNALSHAGIAPDGNPPGFSEGPGFIHSPLFHAARAQDPQRNRLLTALASAGANPFSTELYRAEESEDAFLTMPLESLQAALLAFLQHSDKVKQNPGEFMIQLLNHAVKRDDIAILDALTTASLGSGHGNALKDAWDHLPRYHGFSASPGFMRWVFNDSGSASPEAQAVHACIGVSIKSYLNTIAHDSKAMDIWQASEILKALPCNTREQIFYRNSLFTEMANTLASSDQPARLKTLLTSVNAMQDSRPHLVDAEHVVIALLKNRHIRNSRGLIGQVCECIKVNQPVDRRGNPVSPDALIETIDRIYRLNNSPRWHKVVGWSGLAVSTLLGAAAIATFATRRLVPNAPDLPAPNGYCQQENNLYWSLDDRIKPSAMQDGGNIEFHGNQGCFSAYDFEHDDSHGEWARVWNNRDGYHRNEPGPFPFGSLAAVKSCGADMLEFLGQYPQTLARGSDRIDTYKTVRDRCIAILEDSALKASLDKASIPTITIAGVTLLASAYSIWRGAHDSRNVRHAHEARVALQASPV